MKITLTTLSERTIQKIKNLGASLIHKDIAKDLTTQVYTFIKGNTQVTISKALVFENDNVLELTAGALDDLWSAIIINLSKENEREIRENLKEEDLTGLFV